MNFLAPSQLNYFLWYISLHRSQGNQMSFQTPDILRLLLHCFVACFSLRVLALQSYSASQGSNATITFHHTTRDIESTYFLEFFRLDSTHPFFSTNGLQLDHLHPSQRGRFKVNIQQVDKNVTISLNVNHVEEIDESVYILSIREEISDVLIRNHIYDAYLEVNLPPGNAQCKISICAESLNVCEVNCQATLASNGGGNLCCFQNSEKAFLRRPTQKSGSHMNAVFWMSKSYPINCCSFQDDSKMEPSECADYSLATYASPSTSDGPTTTSVISSAQPFSTSVPNTLDYSLIQKDDHEDMFSRSNKMCLDIQTYFTPFLLIISCQLFQEIYTSF